MAKQSIATSDLVKGKLVFTFANGEKVSVDPAKLSDEIKNQLMIHGLTQKIRDSFAGAKGDVAYAQAAAESTAEALLAGDWNRRGGGQGSTILIEAVARVKGYEMDKAREAVAGLTEEQVAQLKKARAIEQAMLEIRAERKAAAGGKDDDAALDLI